MNCVVIDNGIFDLNKSESNGIISALKLLNSYGYSIIVDMYDNKVDDSIRKIVSGEGIVIKNKIPRKGKMIYEFSLTKTEKPNVIYINRGNGYPDIRTSAESITRKNRIANRIRKTKETIIQVELNLDGNGKTDISTGIGFFDHMLEQIARHGNVDLKIKVEGDLHVDEHHTIEDTGIALGESILEALGDKGGIKRYGYFLPMDDTIAKFAMDIGGRQYLNFKCAFEREMVGEFPTELTEEFFKGVAQGLKANIYIRAKGKNDHHKIEAIFKAFAKSLNEACRIDNRTKGKLPSTKGVI